MSRGPMAGGERTEWQRGGERLLVLDSNSGWGWGRAQSGSDSPLPSRAPLHSRRQKTGGHHRG